MQVQCWEMCTPLIGPELTGRMSQKNSNPFISMVNGLTLKPQGSKDGYFSREVTHTKTVRGSKDYPQMAHCSFNRACIESAATQWIVPDANMSIHH